MEIIQDIPDSVKDDKVSEEGILTFVKDVPTQPIVENIDVNNVKADMPENRSVSTLILAFLDSLLILFILILILYMLIY
ncbi:MAG: hypothetical protein QM532_01595 [Cyanobium sp. MAG06]|nr:hypothetical protein [Cyanobium sp. MAG06]